MLNAEVIWLHEVRNANILFKYSKTVSNELSVPHLLIFLTT